MDGYVVRSQFVDIFSMSWRTLNPYSASAASGNRIRPWSRSLGETLCVSNRSVLLLELICRVSVADDIKEQNK